MLLAHIRINYPEFRLSRLLPLLAVCGLPRVELDDDLLADPAHIDQGSLRAGSGRRTRLTRFPLASLHVQRGGAQDPSLGKEQVEQAPNSGHVARGTCQENWPIQARVR